MKKTILFSLILINLLFIHSSESFSQSLTFQKSYGGFANDEGHDIVQLPDGGFLITGANGSLGDTSFDAYLLKINSTGQTVWEKSFGGNFQDGGNEFAACADGNFFVAGHTESYGLGDCEAWFFLIDANGDTLWTRNYGTPGDDAAYGALAGDDGNYYAVGLVDNGANGGDGFMTKMTPQGNFLWTKLFGASGEDYLTQIRKTDDGNLMLSGKTYVNGYADFWLMKVDTGGNVIWNKHYGTAADEIAFGLRKSPDGGFLITGSSEDIPDSSMSLYFVRTDANGDTLWTKKILNSHGCGAGRAIWTSDNNWVISANAFNAATNSFDACLLKMNDAGQLIWTKYFGGTDDENIRNVIECTNGDFILTGFTKSYGAGEKDVFVVRTNAEGDVSASFPAMVTNNISVQPNPFSENTLIKLTANIPNEKLLISDVEGRILYSIPVDESGVINFERNNLTQGIYFIRLINGIEITETQKMIIE